MFAWFLLMATTIVSSLPVFSDATGHGNQSHLVYAVNQQRWWCFVISSKTATVVDAYVSSSNDLTTATWSAGTSSPAVPLTFNGVEQRNLGVAGLTIGSTDAVHVDITEGAQTATSSNMHTSHIRATFTGASSISWDAAWDDITAGGSSPSSWAPIKGSAVGVGTDGRIHTFSDSLNSAQDAYIRVSHNLDTTATWTNSFNTAVATDASMSQRCNAMAFAPLAAGAMLAVYDNGALADPSLTNLRYNTYSSGTSWPTVGSADVFGSTSTQDINDWALCGVDTTHIFCVRRTGSNTFEMSMFNGSTWAAKTAPPNQNHLAGSGIFLATDGTNMWMFVLDSGVGNPVMYCKYTVGSDSWGTWTQLDPGSGGTLGYISGCPVVGNNQIGVIYTSTNGPNFDILVAALTLTTPAGPTAAVWLLAA